MVSRETQKAAGRRYKLVREKYLGLGVRELERKLASLGLAISHVTIGRYESGDRVAPSSFVQALAELAGIDGHWLLTGEADPERPSESEAQIRLAAVKDALERDLAMLARDAGDRVVRALGDPAAEQEDLGQQA